MDSPVAGVNYSTASQEDGTTNAAGEFQYLEGESVTFRVGGTVLPEVVAKDKVTPLDMGGEDAGLDSPVVVNILRLLQTLDADGDPENGITITPEIHQALNDVDLPYRDAAFESEAANQIKAKLDKDLVSEEDAVEHFSGSLKGDLLGSWIYEEDTGNVNVLTFIDDSTYVIAHSMADDGDQSAGSAEYGTYTWNPVTGEFSITGVIAESDKSGGLYDADKPDANKDIIAGLVDGVITFGLGDGTVEFTKVAGTDNALIGTWYLYEPDSNNHNLLTFLSPTEYVIVHTNNSEAYDGDTVVPVSSEWNTYSWDAASQKMTLGEASIETDGDGGLYSAEPDAVGSFTLKADSTGDLAFTDEDETFHFSRLGSYTVHLQDRDGDIRTATVKRDTSRFANLTEGTWVFPDIGAGTDGQFDTGTSASNTLILEATNNGTIQYPPSEDNDFNENDVNTVTWVVSSSGVLHVTETDSDLEKYYRTFTPLKSKSGHGILMRTVIGETSTLGEAFIVDFEPVLDLVVEITNTVVSAESGAAREVEFSDGSKPFMQCNPDVAPGASESFTETWVLNPLSHVNSYIYEGTDKTDGSAVTYDAAAGTVSVSASEGPEILDRCTEGLCGDITYWAAHSFSWTATVDKNASPMISGEIEETITYTWDVNGSTSVCRIRYEMTGVSAE